MQTHGTSSFRAPLQVKRKHRVDRPNNIYKEHPMGKLQNKQGFRQATVWAQDVEQGRQHGEGRRSLGSRSQACRDCSSSCVEIGGVVG